MEAVYNIEDLKVGKVYKIGGLNELIKGKKGMIINNCSDGKSNLNNYTEVKVLAISNHPHIILDYEIGNPIQYNQKHYDYIINVTSDIKAEEDNQGCYWFIN